MKPRRQPSQLARQARRAKRTAADRRPPVIPEPPPPAPSPLQRELMRHMPVDSMGGAWCQCGWKRPGVGSPSQQWAEHVEAVILASSAASTAALRRNLHLTSLDDTP